MHPVGRAIVIYSPYARRIAHLEQALSQLKQQHIAVTDIISIADLDGLPAQGSAWKAQGLDMVIAAGGDGLVGGVITHNAPSGLPLGIIPLGTANDIARTLHIPQDIRQAIQAIRNGHTIDIDVGLAQPAEQAPHKTSRHPRTPSQVHLLSSQQSFFAHALTIGINVQFARLATNITTRQRFGKLTYPIAALEVLKHHKPRELDIQINGLALPTHVKSIPEANGNHAGSIILTEPIRFHCKTLQATVINAPIFGGQWQLSLPNSSIYDHLLDVVIIADIKWETLLDGLARLFGNHTTPPHHHSRWHAQHTFHPLLQQAELSGIQGVYHFQAQGVVISSSIDPQDVTLDGEIRGQTPLAAHIAPHPLPVIVPAAES